MDSMKLMKLSEVAKCLGISKRTLYNWKKSGKISFEKIGSMNYIKYTDYCDLAHIQIEKKEKVVIYCRVSSTQNKENLETQAKRLTEYCMAKGYQIYDIVKEFGSGINDSRPKLNKLLQNGDFTKLVVEHKDRLTRIGFNYLKMFLEKENKIIEVVNNVETDKEDLVQDFVSIITSYCARIYGKRRTKRKTFDIINSALKTSN